MRRPDGGAVGIFAGAAKRIGQDGDKRSKKRNQKTKLKKQNRKKWAREIR